MIVRRTVFLSPVEPHPLSFRAAMGMDMTVNVDFYRGGGSGGYGHYDRDLGAQMHLTGRTTARTNIYPLAATDIVNGRARAVIPGADITDPNGYRLRLVGTVDGEKTLIATGTVMPIAAAGLEEAIPVVGIERIDLILARGSPANLLVGIWADQGSTVPVDLTSVSLTANITATAGGAAIMAFTVTPGPQPHMVVLGLTVEQLDALPDGGWWTLVGASPGGTGSTTYCEGSVAVTGEVTTP